MSARATDYTRLDHKLTVVLFAGGGGSCIGIERAYCNAGYNQPVDVAVDHDPDAIACHRANHPLAEHHETDVFDVDPDQVTGGRPVGLLWASPDCTDFSKAKGGRPIGTTKRRSLAWVVTRWAFAARPDVMMLENVEEFARWGPLDEQGLPLRDGTIFEAWRDSLRVLGYRVEHRELRACDYGTPTSRRRLYVIARRDGKPIVWPEKTHGEHDRDCAVSRLPSQRAANTDKERAMPRAAPRTVRAAWRTAAECIDWSQPMLSIFATAAEARAWAQHHGRPCPRRPLAEKTLARIARGVVRYVIEAQRPFLVSAFVAKHYGGVVGQPLDQPLGTVTAVDHHAVCEVSLVSVQHASSDGQPLNDPIHTVQASGQHAGLVGAFLAKYYGPDEHGQGIDEPLYTTPTVEIDGEAWVITDIAMRMLTPRELARAQGFPDDYVIDRGGDGRPLSKRTQVRLIGNSVCPPVATALVRANVCDQDVLWRASDADRISWAAAAIEEVCA